MTRGARASESSTRSVRQREEDNEHERQRESRARGEEGSTRMAAVVRVATCCRAVSSTEMAMATVMAKDGGGGDDGDSDDNGGGDDGGNNDGFRVGCGVGEAAQAAGVGG